MIEFPNQYARGDFDAGVIWGMCHELEEAQVVKTFDTQVASHVGFTSIDHSQKSWFSLGKVYGIGLACQLRYDALMSLPTSPK